MTQQTEDAPNEHVAFAVALFRATPKTYFTEIIVGINVIVFVAMGIAGVGWFEPDVPKVLQWGADKWDFTTGGEWWRLLTSTFIHFGLIHIALNMWALVSIGKLTERLYGNVFFLLMYLFSGLLSSLIAVWWDRHSIEAGASGAIFGVYGATLAYLVFQGDSFPRVASKPLMSSVLTFIAYNVYFGLRVEGISNSAHIGGLASGFVIGALIARPLELQRRLPQTLPRFFIGSVMAVAILAGGIYFIPKSRIDPKGEQALETALDKAIAREAAALNKYNTLVVGKELTEQVAGILDREIIPEYDGMASELSAIKVADGSSSKQMQERLVGYFRARANALRTLSNAIRSNDQAMLQDFGRQWKEAADLVEKFNRERGGKAHREV